MSDIKDLKFDNKNFNKHTEFGMGLLEKSLNKFGAGRSILVDKDNNIIAGNGIVEAAANAGLTKTRVVETTGDELVVVKRTDVALNSEQGREMALADNATAQADLEWDEENLKSEFDDETLDAWKVGIKDQYFISADELLDVPPLPHTYTQGEEVQNFESERAVIFDERYEGLKSKAEACKNMELKKILEKRLKDFADFDFTYIADYYQSSATEEEKELIEEFGLVVVTEKRALELDLLDLEHSVILSGGEL